MRTIAALLLLAGAAAAQDLTMKEKTSWFPLDKDATWTYKLQDKPIVMKVVGFEKSDDDVCAKLEWRREGKLVASELWTVTKDGVYRVGVADKKVKPKLLLLKLPPKKDETWKVSSEVGDDKTKTEGSFSTAEEKLKLGDKSYDAIKVTSKDVKIMDLPATTTYWFADKVGLVKQTINIGGSNVELTLEKFEEAKK